MCLGELQLGGNNKKCPPEELSEDGSFSTGAKKDHQWVLFPNTWGPQSFMILKLGRGGACKKKGNAKGHRDHLLALLTSPGCRKGPRGGQKEQCLDFFLLPPQEISDWLIL